MWTQYLSPRSLDDALRLLSQHQGSARPIAGGTGVLVDYQRNRRLPGILIDIGNIPGLDEIRLDDGGRIHLGPLVTHNDVVGSDICRAQASPLVQACFEVGAPQIRNRATVAGNVASASPAGDTITPLRAFDAMVTVQSVRGRRDIAMGDFITAPGKTAIEPDELIVDIFFDALGGTRRGIFAKLGLRRAQAVSVVSIAAVLVLEDHVVAEARLAFGSVGATIIRAIEAESMLVGSRLTPELVTAVAAKAGAEVDPISDIRGSAEYRRYMTGVLTGNALQALADGRERDTMPLDPVMLWGEGRQRRGSAVENSVVIHTAGGSETIETVVNGEPLSIAGANHLTLAQMLRNVAHLSGTKEACGEGECGACTVMIDGTAAMSCLIPAPQADGHRITTVEGLAGADDTLHPVQQAMIDEGALQCGFCTPGFVVAGAALFGERRNPTTDEIKQAIGGNLCRCTSYYPIVAALEAACADEGLST